MKPKNLAVIAFAVSLLAAGCASGSAAVAEGVHALPNIGKPGGGSESSFPVGEITCYATDVSWSGAAEDVQINAGGGLRYTWPPSGLEILTTEKCLANLGQVAMPLPTGRSTVECMTDSGVFVVVAIASEASISSGVTAWRDEDTSDVYLATLACRVRRLN